MRLTLDNWVSGDVQGLQYRTVISQRVDVSPATKVVGRQGEGLDVSQSSQRKRISPMARFRQRRNAFDRVKAQNQVVHTVCHVGGRLIRFGHAVEQNRNAYVGNLASDEHISDQLFRLLPSKLTVVNFVSVVGGFCRVASSDR